MQLHITLLIVFPLIFFQAQKSNQKLIYSDDFGDNLSQWTIEQVEGGTAQINNGKLEIDDTKGCTIWFNKILIGNFKIEYDVTLIDKQGKNDRVSDLNCFWKAIDPKSPNDLLANHQNRSGKFANYHSLKLYYIGFGANNNTTTRFRRYPGDGTRPMLPEYDLIESKFCNIANKVRHIEIICLNNYTCYKIDDETVFEFTDREPLSDGWFGFRTVKNHMTIDNFKVSSINLKMGY